MVRRAIEKLVDQVPVRTVDLYAVESRLLRVDGSLLPLSKQSLGVVDCGGNDIAGLAWEETELTSLGRDC